MGGHKFIGHISFSLRLSPLLSLLVSFPFFTLITPYLSFLALSTHHFLSVEQFSKSIEMYPNQAFSSGSYAEMLSGNPLLSHNYNNNGSVGAPNMVDPACNSFVGGEQNVHGQGLSLSLGTSVPSFQYQYDGTTAAAECMVSLSSGGFHESAKREGLYNSNNSDPCIQGSFSNGVLNSHYLKAAQELLMHANFPKTYGNWQLERFARNMIW
ncbi:hypothetical protein AAHE18_U024600 [Arachis hypogaea]